jgi:hygromycin-B 7''-O-kinase
MRWDTSIDADGFEALRKDPERWLPALADLAAAQGFAGPLRPCGLGSNLVCRVGDDRLLKLFPPIHRDQFLAEHAVLAHLALHPPGIAVPDLLSAGERDGWTWIAMTHLPGTPLETLWPDLSEPERWFLLERLGEILARFQEVPVDGISALEPPWERFLPAQEVACRARQTQVKTPARLVSDLGRYLAATQDALPASFPPVLLTGEWTPENLLVSRRAGGWAFTGMVDFADALVGFAEYDLLGPCVFLAAGDAERQRRFFAGYGYGPGELTAALRRRLLRLLLLHRYSHPPAQIRIQGWTERVSDLDELERLVWPFG